jgi:hypothetical protein
MCLWDGGLSRHAWPRMSKLGSLKYIAFFIVLLHDNVIEIIHILTTGHSSLGHILGSS